MRKKAALLVLFLCVLLVQCGILTEQPYRVYLPAVSNTPAQVLPLKGAALFADDCSAVDLLELDWYYLGPRNCPGAEFVYYEQAPGMNGTATQYTMFYNEPDLQGWTVSDMVTAFIPYAARYPGTVWVGPCVAYDLSLIPQFWQEYAHRTGSPMPPGQIRACVHRYGSAAETLRRVEEAAAVAGSMGLPERSVWLTEFGLPLGQRQTMESRLADTRALLAGLESSPYVERYAYWPGLYWPLPSAAEPWTGAIPLLYVVYLPGGSGDHPAGYRLTAMGRVYRDG